MKYTILLALAGLALAAPLQASEKQDGASQAAESAEKAEKKICKREAAMGSNMTTKVCRTAAEWKAMYERERGRSQDQDKD